MVRGVPGSPGKPGSPPPPGGSSPDPGGKSCGPGSPRSLLSRGVPGSQGVPGDPESSGESFGPGAKRIPPGSGGSSVSPGIPWKSPDPRGRVRLALESRIPGGKGREGGAGFTPGAPSVTLRQAAGADRPWAAPVASRRLGPCHGRGRGRDVRLGRSWRDWRSPGGGERKKGRREEEGAQGG